jgi:hypothetical protein
LTRDAAPALNPNSPDSDPALPARRPFLVSSTRSPLANPRTAIHRLAAALQSTLHFPDPGPLYAVCGTVMANMMRGYPVWLMLVGPPESGKTELLKPLMALDGCIECGDLSGKAALLSATRAKDRAQDATGGILKSLRPSENGAYRGMLVMLDFARTVLASDPASMRATLGAIGMLHDQHYQREVGTDGGKTISFRGRIGFVAATTDVIDHPEHQQANAEMGERCVYCRYPESDGYHEISSALDNPDGPGKSSTIWDLFTGFGREIGHDWEELTPPRPLEPAEKRRIAALAQFTARGRSGVHRDRYNRNEVSGISRSALGPRLANTFAQLMRGMERIGCTSQEQHRVLMQCAMDSLPTVRAVAVQTLQAAGTFGTGLSDVAGALRISVNATKRTLEDLAMHGLASCNRPDGSGNWTLSVIGKELLDVGWAEST